MHKPIVKALLDIRPNAEWTLRGDDYASLEWLDEKQSKPSWQEIENAMANPLPDPQPSVEEKLASVGLNLEDLKAALGLNVNSLEK
jgi:hypothetical protein